MRNGIRESSCYSWIMKIAWFTDDDQDMIKALSLMLRLLDYETRSFPNARKAARALLAGQRPDLLILDINMPEVSGLDLLEFIRSRRQWDDLPVIMFSSEAADVQVDHALALGADAYIFKPVTLDELEAAIAQAMQKRGGEESLKV
ncbi:MAG TPA: response regulator [Chloroflexi bacterium]|nr:response regulator [Chloroflexota bacterium]